MAHSGTPEEARRKKNEYMRRYRQANLEARRESDRAYRAANAEKVAAGIERWRKANPDRVRAAQRGYYERNIDVVKERGKKRYAANPSLAKHHYLKSKYGITYEEFEAMVAAQGGKCAICLLDTSKPVVDHQHSSGRIRQLLCHRCNVGLGQFKDDPERLRRAAYYIEKHGAH